MVKIINLKLFYLLFPGVKKMYLFRKLKRPWAPLPLSIIIKWFSPPKLYPGNTSSLTSLRAGRISTWQKRKWKCLRTARDNDRSLRHFSVRTHALYMRPQVSTVAFFDKLARFDWAGCSGCTALPHMQPVSASLYEPPPTFSALLRSTLLHLSCKLVLMKIHVVLGKVREQQGFVIYLDKVIDYANFKTVKMMPCSF